MLRQIHRAAQPHTASWNALWTLHLNCRAIAQTPKPWTLSLLISAVRPLMVAGEDAHQRSASFAGCPGLTPPWRQHPVRRQNPG